MMSLFKIIIFSTIALTITLTLILTPKNSNDHQPDRSFHPAKPVLEKRASRFLQQHERNPRAADHCNKNNEVCDYIMEGGKNTTCCNNKCIDLEFDDHNCGACKKKCDATDTCCNGECVFLALDKRHCGSCNNKCMENGYCIYGICDYA